MHEDHKCICEAEGFSKGERVSNVTSDYKSLLPTTNINNSKLPQNWTSFQHNHIQTRLKLNYLKFNHGEPYKENTRTMKTPHLINTDCLYKE